MWMHALKFSCVYMCMRVISYVDVCELVSVKGSHLHGSLYVCASVIVGVYAWKFICVCEYL